MTLPKNRSGSVKRKIRKTSKGSKVVFERRKKKLNASCALCKQSLHGIKDGSLSEKRVSRKFGGNLCSKCSEKVIKYSSRIKENVMGLEEVPIIYRKYVEGLIK